MQSILYPEFVDSNHPIVAHLDTVSEEGALEGWAIYLDIPAICHVQVRIGERIVAEDMADKFRRDLLEAGLGFGYCAFQAQLAMVPTELEELRLFDGRTGLEIQSGRSTINVPKEGRGAVLGVESLLKLDERWCDADIIRNLDCLKLEENLEVLGATRYVDRVFRFALGRWADPGGLSHYSAELLAGRVSAKEILVILLSSDERQGASNKPLPSPLDPSFPFVLNPPGGPYRRSSPRAMIQTRV